MCIPISRARQRASLTLFIVLLLAAGVRLSGAHQDPCHRLRSCPSDSNTYVCGDRGRCEQCPDNPYCLAGQLRPAASPPAPPTPLAPIPSQPLGPAGMAVCFTPGGNCTDLIVQALRAAESSILMQAYNFTSAPTAKALLDAHKQ